MSSPGQLDMAAISNRLFEKTQLMLGSLPLLAVAIVVVVLAWMLGGWLSRRDALSRVGSNNPFLQDLSRTTIRWITLLGGILAALEIMDATALVGAVLGTAGILGVALGFAFKDILENYLAGVLMSLRQPFAPRDHVVIATNEGVVVSLNARATTLMTLDGNHLRIPNALVFRSVILNYTRNPNRRFDIEVGIGVNEDLLRAQSLGTDELRMIDGVLADPPPRAIIAALGDSNVQVRYFGWVDQRKHDFNQVRGESIRRIKGILEAAGMDMPEPIYRVQLTDKGAQHAEALPKDARAQGYGTLPDTRVTTDIASQIDREPASDEGDLLDPEAPRE
ncbi:MAG: mechanosensitive ion channel family protein [Pseudoxanthomonas sp.]